jgi:hypothetical protein
MYAQLILITFRHQRPISENAVEFGELETFLRLNEKYDAALEEDRPAPVVQPVGVPGASEPLQMTPDHIRAKILATTPSPLRKGKSAVIPVNKRVGELDAGSELVGFGLQGVKVTHDELADLVAELGLDGDEAGDLVKGLSGFDMGNPKSKSSSSGDVKGISKSVSKEVPDTPDGDAERERKTDVVATE